MDIKQKMIERLQEEKGYLPDEARRAVESAWELIELAFDTALNDTLQPKN